MTKKIVFTGGGTAGHVTPNIALIQTLTDLGWQCLYIGSNTGIEKKLIEPLNIKFYGIATGKLRRYFSWQNFIDPFKIFYGMLQSLLLLSKSKPELVFSKGGFVSFPVVFAAWLKRIPVIAHESDMTPGLATKLSFPFVRHLCINFEKTKQYFKKKEKLKITGTPIRQGLLEGSKAKAIQLCSFKETKPCLLVIGGGLGAVAINKIIRQSLDELLEHYNIIHLCGKAKLDRTIQKEGYRQFEYLTAELADVYALADLIISRSGANSVYEILSLAKPHIFIPLPLTASRGDQIHNANYFKELGISYVLAEEDLNMESLVKTITEVMQTKEIRSKKIEALGFESGTAKIIHLIESIK